jgi:hypothetical protein
VDSPVDRHALFLRRIFGTSGVCRGKVPVGRDLSRSPRKISHCGRGKMWAVDGETILKLWFVLLTARGISWRFQHTEKLIEFISYPQISHDIHRLIRPFPAVHEMWENGRNPVVHRPNNIIPFL